MLVNVVSLVMGLFGGWLMFQRRWKEASIALVVAYGLMYVLLVLAYQ